MAQRTDRRHPSKSEPADKDTRTEFERDRDRILYSAAFRRLAGITQTAPSDLEHTVHNRLTHVLEVAQIGRRTDEHLLKNPESKQIAHNLQINPNVVEAACLAHDLGHPPFGHITEEVLQELLKQEYGVTSGFEGNAQSFRIITRLADYKKDVPGLNLTRATLNATLKYPWPKTDDVRKWGYYASEKEDYRFARAPDEEHTERKSPEAAIMDWADDIAYSVHDMLDFYEAGKIPLDRLAKVGDKDRELDRFLTGVQAAWHDDKRHLGEDFDLYRHAANRIVMEFALILRPYTGDREQRHTLKKLSSFFIGRYTGAITLQQPTDKSEPYVKIADALVREVTMLKELTWHYVIRDPALASQQAGQRVIIKSLFKAFERALQDRRQWRLSPPRIREIAQEDEVFEKDNIHQRCRLVCDLIAGMSEQQAQEMYLRLNGVRSGSAFAMIVL